MARDEPPRPEPTTDISPAVWLEEEIGEFGSGVRGLIPPRFEAYARILHPAGTADGEDVSWAEIAAWSGKRMHALVQFEAISRPAESVASSDRPFTDDPLEGEPDRELLEALCEVLARHTETANRCWLCLWEGWGWIDGGGGPRVRLPGRDYILLAGELAGAPQLGDPSFNPQPPNIFWPDDQTWCVASEIDFNSTYVGGTSALIDEIIAVPRLEAWRVYPDDPVDSSSDRLNDPGSER